MCDPAGWSMPRGLPETSRIEIGISTLDPVAVALPTVTTSCCAIAVAATPRENSTRRHDRDRRRFIEERVRLCAQSHSDDGQCGDEENERPLAHRREELRDGDRAVDEDET